MRMTCVAGLCAAAVALAVLPAIPADAAPKEKKAAVKKKQVVAKKAPPRARVTVQRRSFLDAGTEVLPGERKFTDYAFPVGSSPTGVIDHRYGGRSPGGALPGPFDLPSRNNPYPWNWCVGC